MRNKKIFLFLLVIIVIVCISWLNISLLKISDRTSNYLPSKSLKEEIKIETKGLSQEEIRKYSIKKTASILSFTIKNDISNGKANCVGYAQMCAGISNYAFRINGYNSFAKPVVGYVKLLGVNLCNILKLCMPTKRWENFVKDHDFVEYHIDGDIIYCDASTYDLIMNDCKTIH